LRFDLHQVRHQMETAHGLTHESRGRSGS
jgi:hypothetical protein